VGIPNKPQKLKKTGVTILIEELHFGDISLAVYFGQWTCFATFLIAFYFFTFSNECPFSLLLEGGDLQAVVFSVGSMSPLLHLNLLLMSYMNCQQLKILSTGQRLGSYRGNCCLLCDHKGEGHRNPCKDTDVSFWDVFAVIITTIIMIMSSFHALANNV